MILSPNLGYGKNLFQANKLDVEYSILDKKNRDPYTPQYTGQWKERAALKWNVSVLDFLFWENNIHTETVRTSGQVKTLGWHWQFYAPVPLTERRVELFADHHSRHVVEEEPEDRFTGSDFPVEDSYGIRIKFIK
jgi:hypothetical protein